MSTRGRDEEDFAREIEAHLELEADQLVDEGIAPDEARMVARRRFGNVTIARERFHDRSRAAWLDHLLQDARGAARSIRRYPIAAAVAIVSLALAIGAATVTLTVRQVLFHRPPPLYADPGQLSRIQVARPEQPRGSGVPAPLYVVWRQALGPWMVASRPLAGVRDVRTDDRLDTAGVRLVSPDLFDVLGVAPHAGRTFGAGTARQEAVVSYGAWQRLLDSRPDAIGTAIWIDHQPYTVVGVMPERFWLGDMSSPIWLALDPLALAPGDALEVIARRPADMTPAMLDARLQAGLAEYAGQLPASDRQLRPKVSGIEGTPLGHEVGSLLRYVLATAVLLTLLIACTNVAILMIAQWTAREHEIAIRASIGASRGRIVRALMTESVLIAACGGSLGITVTLALAGWVSRRSGGGGFFDLSIDPHIFAQVAALTLLSGVLAGIAPALYETSRLQANPLRTLSGSDRLRQRWRSALVVFEITVTVALLVVTVSMVHGYQRARGAQMGYATGPLLTARVDNLSGTATSQILQTLQDLPGVSGAAASATSVPPFMGGPHTRVAADAAGSEAVGAHRHVVNAGFFSAVGVSVRAGRTFSDADLASTRIAILNETLARQLFPARDPLGRQVWVGDASYEIAGIVADYASSPLEHPAADPRLFLLLPPDSPEVGRMHFVIRADGDPAALVQSVRRELQRMAPGRVANVNTVDQILSVMGHEILAGTAPLLPLVSIGMLLTSTGIYGILAFAVARRSRELAIRMAIGATGVDLVRLIGWQTGQLVAAGTALGVVATFGLARVARMDDGGGSSIFDPQVAAFIIPVLLVALIGVVATWAPARRARRIDPAALLRSI